MRGGFGLAVEVQVDIGEGILINDLTPVTKTPLPVSIPLYSSISSSPFPAWTSTFFGFWAFKFSRILLFL